MVTKLDESVALVTSTSEYKNFNWENLRYPHFTTEVNAIKNRKSFMKVSFL